jgi:DNA ligase-1
MVRESGYVDGVKTPARTTCTPKNVGRANETTAEQQAELELAAKYQKKRDEGYFDTPEAAETTQVFLPMLAYPYEKRAGKIKWPVSAQPKLDGVRCLASYNGQSWELMSRGGKPYDVQHIVDDLNKSDLNKEMVLDGELYIHEMALQDLVSLVKKPKDGSSEVEYHIYDLFYPNELDTPWRGRKLELFTLDQVFSVVSKLRVVQVDLLTDEAGMDNIHNHYVEHGYEGLIMREAHGTYELSKRSRNLIKYKHFQDEEFKIIGFEEGKGSAEGSVIWICQTDGGKTFKVFPKGTRAQKQEWFQNGDSYIGKQLTVKFFAYTNDHIPQFPIGLTIRDYE